MSNANRGKKAAISTDRKIILNPLG